MGRVQFGLIVPEDALDTSRSRYVADVDRLLSRVPPGCFMLDCGGFPRLTTVELLVHEVLPALR